MPQDWFKCLRKKKRSCLFLSATARRRQPKKSFSLDWAENLAESNHGLLLLHINIKCKAIKNSRKLRLKNLLKIWKAKTLNHGKSSSRRPTNPWLVPFVKEALNLWKMYELGSTWMFQCQNEGCPSHETNLVFPTTEKKQGIHNKTCIGSWLSSYRWRSHDSLKAF